MVCSYNVSVVSVNLKQFPPFLAGNHLRYLLFWGEALCFQDLIPQPETEPQAVAVKAQNPNHRATQGTL